VKKVTKVLDADATCAGCGAFLPKGSVVEVRDGRVYGVECHSEEELNEVFEELGGEPTLEDILYELRLINFNLSLAHTPIH